jgi:leukotriene-A4 hydrolase
MKQVKACYRLVALLVSISVFCSSCGDNQTKNEQVAAPALAATPDKDAHTQSNADSVDITHLYLNIEVSMELQKISGSAIWDITNKNKLKRLTLDTWALTIDSVWADGAKTTYALGKFADHLGSPLHIAINEGTKQVTVFYHTGDSARALQWLTPAQTHDKKQPFLYTQSESIYARSWLPCPDGPGIRYSYDARVKVPTGLLALMSATNPQVKNDSGIYRFSMATPIPAYLMALAVGDVVFKQVNERTGVYAEPGMLNAVHHEFEGIGNMVSTAEKLYGPYRWERYDVIVLPPGFPIGGMENPRLTFCTPTVIAGDRSLVTLIAHELAHSWSGNLVTNATWNDFWLNEGFTVYFERRIMEQTEGASYADMLWELGYQDMVATVNDLGRKNKDTWLKLNLAGRDPDEGLTDIAYEKGAHFLKLVEQRAGREKFDAFLKAYFDAHAFKTMTTEKFVSYLNDNLVKGDTNVLSKGAIDSWVYGPGIPDNCPRAGMERFKKVDEEREKFLKNTSANKLVTAKWTTHEWLHFLRKLPMPLEKQKMADLDKTFKFTQTGNAEIADLWFVMAVSAKYEAAFPKMEEFISRVGRRKFLDPIYAQMAFNREMNPVAKSFYAKYKANYHPIAREHIEAILSRY